MKEVSIRVVQSKPVRKIVVTHLVSCGSDARNEIRMAACSLADEEESRLGIVLLKDLEDLGREYWMRAVIEGKRNPGMMGGNAKRDVARESLEHAQDSNGLYPKHEKRYREECNRGHYDGHSRHPRRN
jgi:hypothetical protein